MLLGSAECFFLVSDKVTADLIKYITKIPERQIIVLRGSLRLSTIALLKLWLRIYQNKFDGSICQYGVNSKLYALLTFFSGIKVRIGWQGAFSFLNTANISDVDLHKVEATTLMMKYLASILKIPLQAENSYIKNIPKSNGAIVLGISSFENEKHKRWPLNKFGQLCKLIYKNFPDRSIILIGSKSERDYAESLIQISGVPTIQNKCGDYSIAESCEKIKLAALVVSNCNAISHMACYFSIPTIGLYGPTDPYITGPKSVIPIKTNVTCAPCYSSKFSQGCEQPICMENIQVDIVYEAVIRILSRTNR